MAERARPFAGGVRLRRVALPRPAGLHDLRLSGRTRPR